MHSNIFKTSFLGLGFIYENKSLYKFRGLKFLVDTGFYFTVRYPGDGFT